MLLHLLDNDIFLNGCIKQFEEYYPKRNIFIVQVALKEKHSNNHLMSNNIYFLPLTSKVSIKHIGKLIKNHNIKHILIHNLSLTKASVVNKFKTQYNMKSYWILYGADLYGLLSNKNAYALNDNPSKKILNTSLISRIKPALIQFYLFNNLRLSVIDTFINKLDYFCFWNEFDYKLLIKSFSTNAKYKYFLYFNVINRQIEKPMNLANKHYLQINHSASSNGNHMTILEKLKQLDYKEKILCPLSYGDKNTKNAVIQKGVEYFGDNFYPILDFLPMEEYYRILSNVKVAIFGNRRQEAGGNVFYLLSQGVKIFLRDDNNLSHFLRNKGFVIFSYEQDLTDTYQLTGLSKEEAIINYNCFIKEFSIKNEINHMKCLIN